MKIKPRLVTVIIVLAFAASVHLPAAKNASAQLTKFRASYAGTTGYHLPIWVQKQENFDKKYGLDMELLLIGGGSRVIQALLGGDLQLTHSGASTVVRAGIAGADLVIAATAVNQITWKIVTRKDIKAPADFLGKKLAITSRGGSSELGLQLAFKTGGSTLVN